MEGNVPVVACLALTGEKSWRRPWSSAELPSQNSSIVLEIMYYQQKKLCKVKCARIVQPRSTARQSIMTSRQQDGMVSAGELDMSGSRWSGHLATATAHGNVKVEG